MVAFLSIWLAWETYTTYARKVMLELETEANRIDKVFIVALDNASYTLNSLSRQVQRKGSEDLDYIARLINSFNTNQEIYALFSYVNTNGAMQVSSNMGVIPKPVDISDRDYVMKSAEVPGRIHIGKPVRGRVSQKWILPMGIGITNDKGKFIGTVTVSVDINGLANEIGQVVRHSKISYALLSENIEKLTESSESQGGGFLEQNFDEALLKQVIDDKRTSGVLTEGNPLVKSGIDSFFLKSQDHPYLIVVGYERQQALSDVLKLFLPKLVQLLVMAGFLLIVMWTIKQRVIKPVVALSESASRIARGERNVPIPFEGPVEINLLAEHVGDIYKYVNELRLIEDVLRKKTDDLKRAKDDAELANRVKSEFLACMSHELRTPLNSIIGFSEIMQNSVGGELNEKFKGYVADIHGSGVHLLEIINDILDIARMEAGAVELHEKEIDVGVQLKKCERLLRERAEAAKIKVKITVKEGLPKLYVDDLRFRQIVINLISNAIKFTDGSSKNGGRINISANLDRTEEGLKCMKVEVNDNGIGIKPEHIPLALSKFAQVDQGITRKYDGAGLGLPLSLELMKMHGGDIAIQSEPGKGTTVTLIFPAERIR